MGSSTIEQAVSVKIKATAAITAYIGTGANARIYWIKAPAGTATLPYITYDTIARLNEAESIGQTGSQATIQLSIWHNHKRNGQSLAEAVMALFDQYSGDLDGFGVIFATATGPVQLQDPDHDTLYQFIVDVDIEFER